MKLRKKVTGAVIIGSLLASLPFSVFAEESKKEQIDYVALGDSLAAGITPYGGDDKGYPEYLAERLKQTEYDVEEFTNYGVSGYTTEQLKNALLYASQVDNSAIRNSIRNAELVTIDIGAVDILALLTKAKIEKRQLTQFEIETVLQQVRNNLLTSLGIIGSLNPTAKVYVMGYYNPFPHYSEQEQAALLPLLDALNQTIEGVVSYYTSNNFSYFYVPTEQVIASNETKYLPTKDIHLSLEGYEAVAKEFWQAITKEK